jgi:hypothetical protein
MVTFASVARKIGNPRLEKVLAQLATNVETDVHNAKSVPRRADLREDVGLLKKQAEGFEKALSRISKGFRLLALPIGAIECLPNARKTARDVTELCDEALSIISPKAGASKKPGRVTCALIVIEAWSFVHGKPPGANNAKAQEACEDYWRAYGGPPIGKGDPGNWRRTIKSALAVRSALRRYIRDEIRLEAEGRSSELSKIASRGVRNRR